jgi:hypothetical protein
MSDPQEKTVITVGNTRQFWPYVVIGLLGAIAVVPDLIHLGSMESKFSAIRLIEIGIILSLLWAAAWKHSVSRFRTPVVLILVIGTILDLTSGHYRATDTLTLVEDCVLVAAALILAWPLKRNAKTFTSIEDYLASTDHQEPQS